jgi:ubiquinone/menaquinone biosynthesis C-methylase UbiE
MSKLSEQIAWGLNQVFHPLSIHQELEIAKSNVEANQQWAYNEAQRIKQAFEPYWDLKGLCVLDIGTGLGGKLPFYVEMGAKAVTGIDISFKSVRTSYQHVDSLGLTATDHASVSLAVTDAACLPFLDNTFDAIVSINVFEHIKQLEAAIHEAYRVLKPGGTAFLHLNPYYSPWGPHLENWIHFPWPHLLFSDRTLLHVAARQDTQDRLNAKFVQAAKIDWEAAGDRIPDVNRVTLRRFHALVKQAGFSIQQLELLPVGYDNLKNHSSIIRRAAFQLLRLGAHIPLLQEIIVTKMVYVLRKSA